MAMRFASLQTRLLALVLALVSAVGVVVAVSTWLDVRHELDELLDAHLAQAAALLVVQQAGELDDDHETVDAPTLHKYAPRVAFQVFHEGKLALRSAQAPTAAMTGGDAGFVRGFRSLELQGQRWRVFAARGAEADVQVYVGEAESSRTDILRAVLRSTLWPLLLALPLLAVGVWWAVRRGTAPLRQLGEQLAQRTPGALDPVVVADAPREMQPMLLALNDLLGRIGELMEGERRFTADAAHELRTPVAAIRMQAQVALREVDDALRRQALTATVAGCDRAVRLVDQMLTLSRMESGHAPALAPVDLAAWVRQVAADLAPQALARSQLLSVDAPQTPCLVQGDATLLSVMLRNLLDNAIRYSPSGGQVEVRLTADAQGVRCAVQDTGPGLDDAALARLGERFFRVLGSGESGSGLGWSIVRRVAALHGAKVTARRAEAAGGLLAEVWFPPLPHLPPKCS